MGKLEYHAPRSIVEAVGLGEDLGRDGRFLAGGTDLVVQIQRGRLAPRHLVALHHIAALRQIDVDRGVILGACVTHRMVERHPAFQGALRGLAEGAQAIGGRQIRNVGTVGGNIANASPAADLVPPLLALDATVTLAGRAGERTVPLGGFLEGPGMTACRLGELVTRVNLRALPPRSATAFLKAGRRRAMEISLVCVAVRLTLDESLERCREARIALGAVAPTTIRAEAAEAALEDQPVAPNAFAQAGALAIESCAPIDDVRASAAYRLRLVSVLVTRALEIAASRIRRTA